MNKLSTFFTFNLHDISWKQFKTYDFWFGYDRFMIHVTDKAILLAGALFLFFGFVALAFSFFAKNQFLAKVAKWKAKILIIGGLGEILWFGLRYQNVQVFGTRFVALLILLAMLVWLYFPAKYFFSRYKTDLAEAERKANKDKYLNMPTR